MKDKDIEAASIKSDDSLLQSLLIIGKLHDRVLSSESLKAGLPLVDNKLTPQLFIRAAKRAGFSARLVQREIKDIPVLVYPVVLILKNNLSCVLTGVGDDGRFEVSLPEADGGVSHITVEELQKQYSGFAVFLKPSLAYEKRSDEYIPPRKGHWFWGTLLLFKKVYFNVALAAFCVNIFALTSSFFIMSVYDRIVPNNAISTLWVFAIGVTIVYVFDFLMRFFRGIFIDRAGKRADLILAGRIFQHTMGLPVSCKPNSIGGFASNLRGYENLREFFTSATLTIFIDLPFAILFMAVIFIIGGSIGFIPLITSIIVVIYSLIFQILIQESVSNAYVGNNERHGILVESMMGFETVKGLCAEGMMQRKMEKVIAVTSQDELVSRQYSNLVTNITLFIQQIVTVILVIFCVYAIKNGTMTMGAMIAVVILSGRALAPLASVAALLIRFQQSVEALQGLNKIMSLPEERGENKEFLLRSQFRPEIQFIEASFAYPQAPGRSILRGITLHIHEGEKVAVLGRIGSGKTTLLKLMIGFYTPISGSVLINGVDSRQLDPVDLRRNIGYIAQDDILFNGTVRQNIMMSAPWASEKNFLESCQLAGVDQFISEAPEGYDMMVGERGAYLSGGQRQAISAARAFLNRPALLLFDEPTSSMDRTTEHNLLTSIRNYMIRSDRTLVISTHKLALLELVDRIIVIDQGRIIADGPRDIILNKLSAATTGN